ncbi:hypothetical protein FXV91_17475 [Methanosarcina sp. DH2]|uniref:hypothetical protein n=1 Tax=Methanosarcina sp. DH2 TaxID=2605639 RepID=UPI001E563840|nr:hypothetical protein [Methanosarcina sp. DH2]MCC4771886.1 hypothetical protein [Methanosarcina sp. DH2]
MSSTLPPCDRMTRLNAHCAPGKVASKLFILMISLSVIGLAVPDAQAMLSFTAGS